METEHELVYIETTLQDIVDFYISQKVKSHVHRSQFFINPLDGKVMLELFVRKTKQ